MIDDIHIIPVSALRPDPSIVRAGTTFSFRAESQFDARLFLSRIVAAGHEVDCLMLPDGDGLPDVDVEIQVNATLEQLRDILRTISDSQVMLQTLRAVALLGNSLERDYAQH